MNTDAAQRITQRAALIAMAEAAYAMFHQGAYWQKLYQQVVTSQDHTEGYRGRTAEWATTIGIDETLQRHVEWNIHFQNRPLGALIIRFQDEKLQTIVWDRAGIAAWQLNTVKLDEPHLLDWDSFHRLIGALSPALALYARHYKLPRNNSATQLLRLLK